MKGMAVCIRVSMCGRCNLTGPRFNIKMTSYQYRKSHCGDKTILRPSYLHNGISYTGKMTSLYWIRAQVYSVQKTSNMKTVLGSFHLYWQWSYQNFFFSNSLCRLLASALVNLHSDEYHRTLLMKVNIGSGNVLVPMLTGLWHHMASPVHSGLISFEQNCINVWYLYWYDIHYRQMLSIKYLLALYVLIKASYQY